MKTLRIPVTLDESVNGIKEIPLTEQCTNCMGQRLTCSKCFGKGEIFTKTGQDIIDFIKPYIVEIIEESEISGGASFIR